MLVRSLLSGIFALASANSAISADANGEFAIRNVGAMTCGALSEALGGSDEAARAQTIATLSAWIGGYLSHANRTSQGTFDIIPLAIDQDVLAIVATQCPQRPPETSIESLVFDIGSALSARRVGSRSEVMFNDGVLALRQSVIVAMQERLIELGHLSGRADGVIGPATRGALASFRAAAGIEDEAEAGLPTFLALMFE